MVVVPSLNADIHTGDFLMATRKSENNARVLSVCQVKSILSPANLEVTWWVVASGDVPTSLSYKIPKPQSMPNQ